MKQFEDPLRALQNLYDRGIIISSPDFEAIKQPDRRVRLKLKRALKPAGASTVTFRVTIAGVILNCGCIDNGTGTSFQATGSIDGTYAFAPPPVGADLFFTLPSASIAQEFFDSSDCSGDSLGVEMVEVEIGIHRAAADQWRVEVHANEMILFDSIAVAGSIPLEFENFLICGADLGPGLFVAASGGRAIISTS